MEDTRTCPLIRMGNVCITSSDKCIKKDCAFWIQWPLCNGEMSGNCGLISRLK